MAGLVVAAARPARAQGQVSRFGIADNSFLVEEAFNQEPGIFQNIFVLARSDSGTWQGAFTQEWPLGGLRNQLSLTVPFSREGNQLLAGDLLVNYRYQLWTGSDSRPAFSPRLTLVLASSAERRPLALAGSGWQMNLPFSKQAGVVFLHGNLGATWLKSSGPPGGEAPWRASTFAAGSVIWGLRPMMHPMVEIYAESLAEPDGTRLKTVTVSPGLRAGQNLGDHQIVIGVAIPITRGDRRDTSALAYLSYELPFRRR